MKIKRITAFLLLVILTQTQLAICLNVGDYNLKFWGGGLHVWLHYPEDTSPGDTVNFNIYIVSSKFSRGNHVGEVKFKISALVGSNQVTLYDDTLIYDTYMQLGSAYNDTISVTIPSDARWYLTLQVDTVSYEQDMTNRQEAHVTFDSTKVVTYTYNDLEQNIQEYKQLYNQLNEKYIELKQQLESIQTPTNGECTQLQTDYLQLMQDYITLTNQYNLFISNNQTIPNNQDMEELYSNLIAEFEGTITELEQNINEKEEHIAALQGETQGLHEENQNLVNELMALEEELEHYQTTHQVSEEEYDQIHSRLGETITIRNMLGLTTLLSLLAAIAVYLKFGRGLL